MSVEPGRGAPDGRVAGLPADGAGGSGPRLHADDLGATVEVNEVIGRLLHAGRLVGVPVLANGPATDEALRLLSRHPGVAVHVHADRTEGRPLTAARDLRPLMAADGRFVGVRDAALALARGRGHATAIAAEVTAQIDRVVAARVSVTAVDTHHHLHAHAPVDTVVTALARDRRLAVGRRYAHARTHTLGGAGRKAARVAARGVAVARGRPPPPRSPWPAGNACDSGRPAAPTIVVCHPGGACDRGDAHLLGAGCPPR